MQDISNTHILIVEDEDSLREPLSQMLRFEGFQVSEASDGQTGIDMAINSHPNLILCDIMMPRMNGYQVLEKIRQDPQLKDVAFLFMTAKASLKDIRVGMNMGAEDYLIKPIPREDLLQAIQTQLTKKQEYENSLRLQTQRIRAEIASRLPHELLTPLNGVLGMASLLGELEKDTPIDEVQNMGKIIYQCGEHLNALIQRFLAFIELQKNPRISCEMMQYINTQEVILKAISNISKRWDRQQDIQAHIRHSELLVNKRAFSHIIEQVIDNAFKFSKPGTLIEVKDFEGDNFWNLVIENASNDSFPKQQNVTIDWPIQPKTFSQKGIGLGIEIIQTIIQELGGKWTLQCLMDHTVSMHVCIPIIDSSK